MSQPFWT